MTQEKNKLFNEFLYFKKLIKKKKQKIEHLIEDKKEEQKEPEFEDLCTKYTFDKFADNIRFNERFNEIPFFLEIDYTEEYINCIESTILLNANTLFFFYGPKNMCKSSLAQDTSFIIQESEWELKNRVNKVRNLFNDKKLRKKFRKMKFGDITIRDESPKPKGEGSQTVTDCLNNICQITRAGQYFFLFCNPTLIRMKDIDYYIEMAGKKIVHECSTCGERFLNAQFKRIRKCHVCGQKLDYEKDLIPEECKIRAILYDREHEILGFIFRNFHNNSEFRQKYEKKKMANIKSIMANAGLVEAGQDGDELDYNAKRLAKFCLKTLSHKSKLYKSDIKAQIKMFNTKYPEEEIAGIGAEIKDLLSITLNKMERKRAKQKALDKEEKSKDLSLPKDQGPLNMDFSDFKCNNEQIFYTIRKRAKWQKVERDLSIYVLVMNNYDKKALTKLHKIKVSAIEKVVKRVQGSVNYYKGKMFEKFVKNRLERSSRFKKIEMWAGPGEPDILAYTDTELFIISIKNLKLSDNQKWISKEELTPEINFALLCEEDYETYMIVLILDNLTGEIIKKDYDFHNPSDITDFEKFTPKEFFKNAFIENQGISKKEVKTETNEDQKLFMEDEMVNLAEDTKDDELGYENAEVIKVLRNTKCISCPGSKEIEFCQIRIDYGCPPDKFEK